MLEWILIAIGVAGFGLAGYLDLKTTEFPDWLPYSMIIAILAVRGIFSFLLSDFTILFSSIVVGVIFLAFGLALYFLKQWGDGDAWLLGALGFLFPNTESFSSIIVISASVFPVPLILLFNLFFVAFIYLIVYSIFLGLKSPKVTKNFFRDLKGSSRSIISVIAAFSVLVLSLVFYLTSIGIPLSVLNYVLLSPVFLFAIIVFLHYGKFIEKTLFKKKIPVKKLRVGDVPVSEKWRILSKEEVRKLKARGGSVWIKEGVRFAPVFVITFIATLIFGNLLLLIL